MSVRIRADALLTFVQQRHSDPGLSLKTVSQKLNVSAEYLGRLFARRTGESFRQYLLRVRVKSAVDLLTNSDHDIKTIAGMVGYRQSKPLRGGLPPQNGSHPEGI